MELAYRLSLIWILYAWLIGAEGIVLDNRIDEPLISVIIPVFNGMLHLDSCLESLLRQTQLDFEIIVVDDGSTDGSGEFCEQVLSEFENASVLHKQNEGLLMARRDGLARARGKYVQFLDADDSLRIDAIEILSRLALEDSPDIVMFDYSREPMFAKGKIRDRFLPYGEFKGIEFRKVQEAVCEGELNNLCTKLVKRSLFDLSFDYSDYTGLMHGEDLFQLLPVINNATSAVHVPDVLYYYRMNEGGSTTTFRRSQISDLNSVFMRLRSYAQSWGEECESKAGNLIASHSYWMLCNVASSPTLALNEKRELASEVRSLCCAHGGMQCQKRAIRADAALGVAFLEKGYILAALAISRMTALASSVKNKIRH